MGLDKLPCTAAFPFRGTSISFPGKEDAIQLSSTSGFLHLVDLLQHQHRHASPLRIQRKSLQLLERGELMVDGPGDLVTNMTIKSN